MIETSDYGRNLRTLYDDCKINYLSTVCHIFIAGQIYGSIRRERGRRRASKRWHRVVKNVEDRFIRLCGHDDSSDSVDIWHR